MARTIEESNKLLDEYMTDKGWRFVCTTYTHQFIVKDREQVRAAKGGFEFRRGKRWVFTPAYQCKMVQD